MSSSYISRAARLDKLADKWLTLCEKAETIEDMREARMLVGAICQIENCLKSLRREQRGAQSETDAAGSAVRKYAAEFVNGDASRAAIAGPVLYESDIRTDDDSDTDSESGER